MIKSLEKHKLSLFLSKCLGVEWLDCTVCVQRLKMKSNCLPKGCMRRPVVSHSHHCLLSSVFLKQYIYPFRLQWVLVITCGIFNLRYGRQTLSFSMWDLIPLWGFEPRPPVLGPWSLSHWTTRKYLCLAVLSRSVMSDSLRLHGLYPSRVLCP